MFSLPVSSNVKGVDDVQAVETDSSSEVNEGGIAPMAGPATVDGSSLGIELDDLTLDVLLVSLRFDRCRSRSVDTFPLPRMSNCQRIPQVWICFTPSAPFVNVIFILSIHPYSDNYTLEPNIRKFLCSILRFRTH